MTATASTRPWGDRRRGLARPCEGDVARRGTCTYSCTQAQERVDNGGAGDVQLAARLVHSLLHVDVVVMAECQEAWADGHDLKLI